MRYEIMADGSPENPREYACLGKIVYGSTRYNLGDERVTFEVFQRIIKAKHYIVLPVYASIHSDVQLSTVPFNDPWDSFRSGCIYVSKEDVKSSFGTKIVTKKIRKLVEEALKEEVRVFSLYLSGEVYGYRILNENQEVASVWGFYGFDAAESAAKDELKRLQ